MAVNAGCMYVEKCRGNVAAVVESGKYVAVAGALFASAALKIVKIFYEAKRRRASCLEADASVRARRRSTVKRAPRALLYRRASEMRPIRWRCIGAPSALLASTEV